MPGSPPIRIIEPGHEPAAQHEVELGQAGAPALERVRGHVPEPRRRRHEAGRRRRACRAARRARAPARAPRPPSSRRRTPRSGRPTWGARGRSRCSGRRIWAWAWSGARRGRARHPSGAKDRLGMRVTLDAHSRLAAHSHDRPDPSLRSDDARRPPCHPHSGSSRFDRLSNRVYSRTNRSCTSPVGRSGSWPASPRRAPASTRPPGRSTPAGG